MILVVVKDSTINILSFIYKTPQELPRVTMTQPLMQESPKHIMDATPQMSILLLFFTTEPGHSRTIQAGHCFENHTGSHLEDEDTVSYII